ncbi:uncharacterized protein N7483_007723 [Penicillium malachiteum]|uniref:uncharacterized protein n=1 Tax=Penicillium malachiteum TaxID=1324776 RepID=UPI002548388E|nr:uncharacterized protein N7483_007723 [Penicillium malachiteum]KAJ5726366.1 hypothetical protein N7483_007723 [Penicillium malachiteum]
MPTKRFRSDLQEAAVLDQHPHLSQIKPGDYEGSISFNFHQPESETEIEFQVVVSDASDYPTDHSFVVFAVSDHVSPSVTKALERAQDTGMLAGISINEVLIAVDHMVCNAIHGPQSLAHETSWGDENIDDTDGSLDGYENFSEADSDDEDVHAPWNQSKRIRQQVRNDLRAIKAAGFKFGCLGKAEGSFILAVSSRISKLGIPEEAIQAWNLQSSDYLVLLIRYSTTYQNLLDILDRTKRATNLVEMRVCLCDSYKPPLQAAIAAFKTPLPPLRVNDNFVRVLDTELIRLRELSIGLQLNKLLNERFFGIMTLRKEFGFSWTGAELFFHSSQVRAMTAEEASDSKFCAPENWVSTPPNVLVLDHFVEMKSDLAKASFPLVAWQFLLRHFVKCTEFCLVCHCKTFDKHEALKPYVCSSKLCLYQYVTFGMGICLEHEIRSQPFVVDLLVSLAYARAKAGRLEDFPNGLGIRVPGVDFPCSKTNSNQGIGIGRPWKPLNPHSGVLNRDNMNLFCEPLPGVSTGDWLVIIVPGYAPEHYQVRRIDETEKYLALSHRLVSGESYSWSSTTSNMTDVNFVLYDQDFDELTAPRKQIIMQMILDTLPPVQLMKEFLGSTGSQTVLSTWRNRITPAALDILRWIVASNRSCILQDNEDPRFLVTQMQGYVQFRFVQGAPDKEQHFAEAVKSVSMPVNPSHPTLFAWHGSPAFNWHSILREGLHFKEISNGRACGDGVYMSNCFNTSVGYSGGKFPEARIAGWVWPNSELDLRFVVSLNEIVNKPDEFVSSNPHFVVQQLEWIQPRYLFVGTPKTICFQPSGLGDPGNLPVYDQDPKYLAYGPTGQPVKIPLSAVSMQQRRMIGMIPPEYSPKRQRLNQENRSQIFQLADSTALPQQDESCASVSTEIEDLNLLLSDSEEEISADCPSLSLIRKKSGLFTRPLPANSTKPTASPKSGAAFVPGTLTESSLPLLPPPDYATTSATKLLQQHLQITLRLQQKEPLAELGWYVDPNMITTVYQWIVEFHSFDFDLPLAKDLKAANLNSVVMEIRFPPQFPMDPPFVRVIRPRFMEFTAGGGGHITAGGAMCMELLTSSGWSPVASIESVLLQVRMAISSTEPRPARLAKLPQSDYSVGEAVRAFQRACLNHGWKIPNGMELISW